MDEPEIWVRRSTRERKAEPEAALEEEELEELEEPAPAPRKERAAKNKGKLLLRAKEAKKEAKKEGKKEGKKVDGRKGPKNPGAKVVGAVIELYWAADKKWWPGTVQKWAPSKKRHLLLYDDGVKEWVRSSLHPIALQGRAARAARRHTHGVTVGLRST